MLLQLRRDTGQWAIPMGKQDVAQCAVRETLEETGVVVEVTGLLGIYSEPRHIVAHTDGEVCQEYEVILPGRLDSGELVIWVHIGASTCSVTSRPTARR